MVIQEECSPPQGGSGHEEAERPLPLSGIRVIDFSHFVAGPHCGLWLASLGADVIKIESPRRPDGFRLSLLKPGEAVTLNNSPMFVVSNLMKRSCCIDIAAPDGQAVCHELIGMSDVVIANYRPGVLEDFSLGYDAIRKTNPQIIMATVTGYGYGGAMAAFQALGPNIHAFSGLSASTGYPDGAPEQFFGTYGDVISGQVAAFGILAAINDRARTGQGCYLDTSMAEAVIALAPGPVLSANEGMAPVARSGNDEHGQAPHGCYPCTGRDRWVAIGTFDDDDWERVTSVLGLEELRADARFGTHGARWDHRRELDVLIADATRTWDGVELVAELQRRRVPASVVRTAADVLMDEQLHARGFVADVMQPELGTVCLPKLPWMIDVDGHSERPIGPAPGFGEHTRDVLIDLLGMPEERYASLLADGVIGEGLTGPWSLDGSGRA